MYMYVRMSTSLAFSDEESLVCETECNVLVSQLSKRHYVHSRSQGLLAFYCTYVLRSHSGIVCFPSLQDLISACLMSIRENSWYCEGRSIRGEGVVYLVGCMSSLWWVTSLANCCNGVRTIRGVPGCTTGRSSHYQGYDQMLTTEYFPLP